MFVADVEYVIQVPKSYPNSSLQITKTQKQKSLTTSYHYALQGFTQMWDRAESNRRHTDFQSVALPTELQSLSEDSKYKGFSNLPQNRISIFRKFFLSRLFLYMDIF
jgi:hypothetical protein